MKQNFVIYKASAGSGKTFRLAAEYIKLLIDNPKSYRNILAVTFTNKATAEMKNRIMSELYGLSKNLSKSKHYLQTICDETKKTEDEIRRQTAQALTLILHDYGKFRIETIDSFFQSVLRNMAKELGMSANFTVSINDNEILQNAIAMMIDSARDNNSTMQWLKEYISQKLAENKNWNIIGDIEKFYKNIISEKFKSRQDEICKRFEIKDFLRSYKAKLNKIIEIETDKMKEFAAIFSETTEKYGLKAGDFAYSDRGVYNYFKKLETGQFEEEDCFNTHVQNCADDAQKWSAKNKSNTALIISLAENLLMSLLNKAEQQRKISAKTVISCRLVLKNINNLGLLGDILKHVRQYCDENNVFPLSDTSVLLSRMIGSNDTSFIFEKTGTVINHIMIDEFQDTSQLQWENFEPLLIESLSQGFGNLIVGDVKQAIYRWRNGNWQILNNIEKSNKLHFFNPVVKNLSNSWRSAKSIVEFNNMIFPKIIDILQSEYIAEYGEECEELKNAYSDVNQECKRGEHGFVSVEFIDEENYEEDMFRRLVENAEMLQASGIKESDIAILVRKNDHTKKITYYFEKYKQQNPDKNYCYNLISSKTFTLSSSIAINMIIDALRMLQNPENTVAQAELAFYYQKNILGSTAANHDIFTGDVKKNLPETFVESFETLKLIPLYELIEKIYSIFNLEKLNENAEYMFSFLDRVNEFSSSEISDVSRFLEYWETDLLKETIEISDDADGIKILTIHEAKGLEFDSVIIPFCDWTLGSEGENYIWCETAEEPFSETGLIPIKYVNMAKKSIFEADYKSEAMQLCIDNLNILYVAATRAKNNMIILARNDMSDKTNNVSAVMAAVLDNKNFMSGKITTEMSKAENIVESRLDMLPEPMFVPFISQSYNATFVQSGLAREFMQAESNENTQNLIPVNRGKILHRIFAEIKTKNDIDTAIERFWHEGITLQNDKQELKNFVATAISKSQVEHWYSGKYKLFTESTVITKNDVGDIIAKRPDRVMIDDENTIIVDFKFGKQNRAYNAQVIEYMKLMNEMHYKNIRGFLWYVDDNVVEEIKNN